MKVRKYRLLEDGKEIIELGTAKEIRDYLGMPALSVGDYWKNNRLVKRKYRIELVGMEEVIREKKEKPEQVNTIPKSMWEEWERVCSRFRGVRWKKA